MQKKTLPPVLLGIVLAVALISGGLFYISNQSEWSDPQETGNTAGSPPPVDPTYRMTDTDSQERGGSDIPPSGKGTNANSSLPALPDTPQYDPADFTITASGPDLSPEDLFKAANAALNNYTALFGKTAAPGELSDSFLSEKSRNLQKTLSENASSASPMPDGYVGIPQLTVAENEKLAAYGFRVLPTGQTMTYASIIPADADDTAGAAAKAGLHEWMYSADEKTNAASASIISSAAGLASVAEPGWISSMETARDYGKWGSFVLRSDWYWDAAEQNTDQDQFYTTANLEMTPGTGHKNNRFTLTIDPGYSDLSGNAPHLPGAGTIDSGQPAVWSLSPSSAELSRTTEIPDTSLVFTTPDGKIQKWDGTFNLLGTMAEQTFRFTAGVHIVSSQSSSRNGNTYTLSKNTVDVYNAFADDLFSCGPAAERYIPQELCIRWNNGVPNTPQYDPADFTITASGPDLSQEDLFKAANAALNNYTALFGKTAAPVELSDSCLSEKSRNLQKTLSENASSASPMPDGYVGIPQIAVAENEKLAAYGFRVLPTGQTMTYASIIPADADETAGAAAKAGLHEWMHSADEKTNAASASIISSAAGLASVAEPGWISSMETARDYGKWGSIVLRSDWYWDAAEQNRYQDQFYTTASLEMTPGAGHRNNRFTLTIDPGYSDLSGNAPHLPGASSTDETPSGTGSGHSVTCILSLSSAGLSWTMDIPDTSLVVTWPSGEISRWDGTFNPLGSMTEQPYNFKAGVRIISSQKDSRNGNTYTLSKNTVDAYNAFAHGLFSSGPTTEQYIPQELCIRWNNQNDT